MCVFVLQSDGRGQTQPDQHHRVQSAGRVERHAGVHVQQRGNQSDRHGQAPGHQEEAEAGGTAGEKGIQVKIQLLNTDSKQSDVTGVGAF